MRLQLAACVVRGHAQLLLARAQMARGQAPPHRHAAHGVQADVDACGGVDGLGRRVWVSAHTASCRVLAVPAVPAAGVHRVDALISA